MTFVQAPNGPKIPLLLGAILQALGREPGRRGTTAQLRSETYRAMHDAGLRLLLIDDLHNIRGSGVGSMLVELRNMGSITGVSLGCFATKEIAYALRQDEQMANRFELLTLPRWQFDDLEYAKLLATFEQQIPLWQSSGLTGSELAQHIQLGTAQRAGVAEQQQRPVALSGRRGIAGRDQAAHLLGRQRGGLPWRAAIPALDAAQRVADRRMRRLPGLAGEPVRPAQRGQPPHQGAAGVGGGERGEIGADRRRIGRQRRPAGAAAPGTKMLPIRAVGA